MAEVEPAERHQFTGSILDQIAHGGSVHEADCTAQVRIPMSNNAKAYAEVECIRHGVFRGLRAQGFQSVIGRRSG